MAKCKDDEIVVENDEFEPVERIESYLDEAQELLDVSERVADRDLTSEQRQDFRFALHEVAEACRVAHGRVKNVLRCGGRKVKRRKRG